MNRRSAGQSSGSDNLSATLAADRAFPPAVAELGTLSCLRGSALRGRSTQIVIMTMTLKETMKDEGCGMREDYDYDSD